MSFLSGNRTRGGLVVKERLGTGATATALLVPQDSADGTRELVLKVARDERHQERLEAEARTIAGLRHPLIAALVRGPVTVGNRTALLLESAGKRTLADDLRAQVAVMAEVRDLVDISVGADVSLGKVELKIEGVEAQALLKAKLDNVSLILAPTTA